jgi:hypothetical protein
MKAVFLAGLAALVATVAGADKLTCRGPDCALAFNLQSVSDAKSYGLLLEAPMGACGRVRYRVTSAGAEVLGHTPPLGPGEVAVVRMGRGFAEGDHILRIAADGCADPPLITRRVTLAKASPDHGWRAAEWRSDHHLLGR